MRKFLFIVLSVLFVSCQSTESRIKKSIEQIIKNELISNGEKIESLKIDSISYHTSSEKDYWLDLKLLNTPLLKTANELVDAGDLKKAQEILDNVYSEEKTLDSLSNIADTSKNLFEVNCNIEYATDKRKDEESGRIFFFKKNNLSRFNPMIKK